MQTRDRNPIRVIIAGLLALGCMGTAVIATPVSSQDTRYLCVAEPNLAFFDPNDDGVLTLAELKDIVARFPDNQSLQDVVVEIRAEGVHGVQYLGICEGIARDGESVVGRDGQSVVGQDGESVVGQDGQSVVVRSAPGEDGEAGQDGQSVAGAPGQSVVGEDGESVVGEDGESVSVRSVADQDSKVVIRVTADEDSESVAGEVCAPNPRLALADGNDDGVVSMDEIDDIIELVGGNVDLEAVRDRAVDAGITGIRYRDCNVGTPAASPVVATPAATPANGTPVAFSAQPLSDADTEGQRTRGANLMIAGASGVTVLACALFFRSFRRT